MTDVDHPVVVERYVHGGKEEADIIGTKGLDHRLNILSFLLTNEFTQLLYRLWPTHLPAITSLNEREKYPPGTTLLLHREAVINLGGVVIEGIGQLCMAYLPIVRGTDNFKVFRLNLSAFSCLSPVPHAQQRMFQDRQLILASQGINHFIHQHRIDLATHK